MQIDLKQKKLRVDKHEEGLEFELSPPGLSVIIGEEELYKLKSALEAQFFGTLKQNVSVQGKNGYLVFFKGKDRWGLRLSDGQVREAVYLSRFDVLQLKHFLGG